MELVSCTREVKKKLPALLSVQLRCRLTQRPPPYAAEDIKADTQEPVHVDEGLLRPAGVQILEIPVSQASPQPHFLAAE